MAKCIWMLGDLESLLKRKFRHVPAVEFDSSLGTI